MWRRGRARSLISPPFNTVRCEYLRIHNRVWRRTKYSTRSCAVNRSKTVMQEIFEAVWAGENYECICVD
jgi:hypothetical protein